MHSRPFTSTTWMNWPALTSYALTVPGWMSRSITGSASGGGAAVGRLPVRPRLTADVEHDLGRGALCIGPGIGPPGAPATRVAGSGGDERGRRSGARFVAEQPHHGGPAEVEAAGREGVANALGGGGRAIEDGLDTERRPGPFRADERGVRAPAGIEDHQLAGLPAPPDR